VKGPDQGQAFELGPPAQGLSQGFCQFTGFAAAGQYAPFPLPSPPYPGDGRASSSAALKRYVAKLAAKKGPKTPYAGRCALTGGARLVDFALCPGVGDVVGGMCQKPTISSAAIHLLILLCPRQMAIALAARAVVRHLVTEDVAVDAEVPLAHRAFVPATLACAFCRRPLCFRTFRSRPVVRAPQLLARDRRESGHASVALTAPLLRCPLPADLHPIHQWE